MPNRASLRRSLVILSLAALGGGNAAQAQTMAAVAPAGKLAACPADSVVAITPPATPLPSETTTAALTKFTFIAYGDTRGRHDGQQLQAEHQLVVEAMLAKIKALASGPDPVRFVLQSGDAVRVGTSAAQWNVSYIPLINRLTTEGGVPYLFSVGNHDVTSSEDLTSPARITGLCNVFAANRRLIPAAGAPHRLTGYPDYGFGFGNTWFIALDSDIAGDSTQLAWVTSELASLDRRRYPNVVAFFHHPAFSSGPHGGAVVEQQTAELRSLYMPLFRKHHVRLLLAGHEHLFEHWIERWTDGSGAHRMDQIVSGGGGAPLYGYSGEPDLRAYLAAGASEKLSVEHLVRPGLQPGASPFHYLVVHVDGDQFRIEVFGVDWGSSFAPYGAAGRGMTLTDAPGGQR
ncbi:MAG: metallophosphoesterase family protein [Gemmatimonadaceae bacterium]